MELDHADLKPIITRMKRAHGHLGSVIAMLEGGADCEDALTQLAAVSKALSRAGFALVSTGLQHCLTPAGSAADGETSDERSGADGVRSVDIARLEKLFLSLA